SGLQMNIRPSMLDNSGLTIPIPSASAARGFCSRTIPGKRMKKPDSDAAWWAGVLTMVLGLVVAMDAGGAGAMLCQKPNGLVILRSGECKPRETSMGALGQPGPTGPTGRPGPMRATGT